MDKKTVVVTGAGRGMGLRFTSQHLERGDRVFTLTRTITNELEALDKKDNALTIIQCDIASTESVEKAAAQIKKETDSLDIIYNNAAIISEYDKNRLLSVDVDYFLDVLNINTLGALRVLRALQSFFKKGFVVLNVSSEVGSIYEVQLAKKMGNSSYMTSKAALNMAIRVLQNIYEKDGVYFFLLEPGWVRTEMAINDIKRAPKAVQDDFANRSVAPEDTVAHMIDIALHPDKVPEGHIFISHQMKLMNW